MLHRESQTGARKPARAEGQGVVRAQSNKEKDGDDEDEDDDGAEKGWMNLVPAASERAHAHAQRQGGPGLLSRWAI